MALGFKTGGRKKGTPNHVTTSVREALVQTFDLMGGVPAFLEWGKQPENRTEFYKLWVKALPVQHHVSGANGGPIQAEVKFDFSKIPTPELNEYESVLAKLKERMGQAMGSSPIGEVPSIIN